MTGTKELKQSKKARTLGRVYIYIYISILLQKNARSLLNISFLSDAKIKLEKVLKKEEIEKIRYRTDYIAKQKHRVKRFNNCSLSFL